MGQILQLSISNPVNIPSILKINYRLNTTRLGGNIVFSFTPKLNVQIYKHIFVNINDHVLLWPTVTQ